MVRLSKRRRRTEVPKAQGALDHLKYEVADELGLSDDIERNGWGEMTTRQVGRIGGHMVRRMVRFAEDQMADGQGASGTPNTDR